MRQHFPLNPATGVEDPTKLPWTDGIPSTGQEGSFPPSAMCVETMMELVNLLGWAGLTGTSADLNQVTRAVRGGQLDFDATDIGTADAVLCQIGLPHTQLAAGLPFTFIKGPNSNTGAFAPTLTITDLQGNNGLTGAIFKANGGALAKGDLPAGALITVRARAPGVFAVVSMMLPSDVGTYLANNYIISTAVTKTISTDFPTLAAAFTWVSSYRIAATGSVQFVLPAGQTVVNAQFLAINHPDGSRITIVGAAMKTAAPTAANFQVTGYSASQRANDKAANLAMCRARYGSEILLTGGSSIVVTANFGGLANLLVSSDGTQNTGAGMIGDIFAVQAGLVYATNCVFAGCASRGVVSTGSATTILGSCFAFGNANHGFSAEGGGKLVGTTAAASFGNGGNGVFSSNGSLFGMDQTVPNSNLTAQGNAQNGVLASANGVVSTVGPAANLSTNGGCGGIAYARGTIIADGATAANNGAAAFNAAAGGYVSALNTSGSGNATYGYNASGSSLVVATGGNANGSSGSMSPAANTVGNGNAYIYQ